MKQQNDTPVEGQNVFYLPVMTKQTSLAELALLQYVQVSLNEFMLWDNSKKAELIKMSQIFQMMETQW